MKEITCAVIMGDIVRSRQSPDTYLLHEKFNTEVNQINQKKKALIISPLTITLGDEFQGLVKTLEGAFQMAFNIRHALLRKAVSCRFVIGLADIQTKINTKMAWNMMGPGLAEARMKLSAKEDKNCYRFSFPEDPKIEKLLNGLGLALTVVETKWTPTQLKYISEILVNQEIPKSKIAKHLDVAENTLYKVLRSADSQYYLQQKYTVEEVLRLMDSGSDHPKRGSK